MTTPSKQKLLLSVFIVNNHDGVRVSKLAKKNGVKGTTAFLGHGTIDSNLLDFLGLNDVRKELVLMVSDEETSELAMEAISKNLKLQKPGRGIAFVLDVTRIMGIRDLKDTLHKREERKNIMHEAIFVIVDKGEGENIIESAKKAGSQGATLINARGSGIHEKGKLFGMDIEPEKEIILILSESAKTEGIIAKVSQDNHLEEPGRGILFTVDVSRTLGLFQSKDTPQL